MSSTSAPFGLRPVYHPSGVIRQEALNNGIASGYTTVIWSGTPVKFTNDGTLSVTATGASSTCGVFMGCEYTQSTTNRFIVSPYWPASESYVTTDGLMQAYFTADPNIIYEAQCDGSVAATDNFAGINLVDAPTSNGSTYTGQSAQRLNHTTTAGTTATWTVVGLAPYSDNAWSDTYTIVRVKIQTYSPAV